MTWIADNAGLTGLLFFFVFFCCMAVWIYLPRNKAPLEELGNIPFDEDHDER
jgi:cbb3-type cytochrome oxidase subunit 3